MSLQENVIAREPSLPMRLSPGLPVALLLVLLLLLAIAGFAQQALPEPQSTAADAATFSSARAMAYLPGIASEPHPLGSAAHDDVRDYVLGELRTLGFEPQVQTGVGRMIDGPIGTIGAVENILVRIPGTAGTAEGNKAVVLSAHYDSVDLSPGAADNGASVAAVLETLRALQAGAPLQNDVIALFTDGEEAGLLGAELFGAEHPWAADVGVVLNFDFRGSSGPMWMFETSPGNGRLIAALAESPAHPRGNSLLYEVYKLLPNDTDMSAYKRAGMAGLNFAAIEHSTTYHSPLDTIDRLSESTLQHQGELMLTLARQFGAAELDDFVAGNTQDRVFFNLPGIGIVHYPTSAVLPLALLVVVLFAVVLAASRRRGDVRLRQVVAGAFAFVAMFLLLGIGAQVLWVVVGLLHPEYRMFADLYNSQWYLLAFSALVVAGFAWMQAKWRAQVGTLALAFGAMLVCTLWLLVTSLLLPGASFLFMWPLLSMLLVLGALLTRRGTRLPLLARALLLFVGLLPGLMLYVPMTRLLFDGLGPHVPFVTAVVLAQLLGLAVPLLALLTRRWVVPLLPAVAALAFLVAGSVTARFDTDRPLPSNLFYVFDASSGSSMWISRDDELDAWTRGFFADDVVPSEAPAVFGPDSPPYWIGPAAPVPGLAAPLIETLSDTRVGDVREVSLQVSSPRGAPALTVRVDGAEVIRSSVQGQPLTGERSPYWKLDAWAMADAPIRIDFAVDAGTPFQVRVYDQSWGLPGERLTTPRPASLIPAGYLPGSDTLRTVQIRKFD